MYVVKRDGRQEPVHFDKITARLTRLSYGLSTEHCDPVLVAQKVCAGIYKGITTSEIGELAAETAAAMTTSHPDYASLAARIAVSNLHKNTMTSFSATVKALYTHYDERSGLMAPLIADDVFTIIMKNTARLECEINYDRDFDYDYFGFKTLQRSYLLKVDGKVAERPQHMLMRVSVGIHKDDIESAIKTYHMMSQRWFTHASPTLFNAGTPRPQLSGCFLICMKDDSIEGIYDTLSECAAISKSAGGIGVSIHNIRATGSYIRGTNGTSNGIVPMLRIFNDTARYVDQGGGKRKGAFAVYLEPWHPDIFEFLDLRKNHANTFSVVFSFCDEALPTTTFSLYFLFLLYLLRLCVTGTLRCVERRVSWFVLCRCRAADPKADGEVKIKEGVPCRRPAGSRGRADVRLGSRDRIAGWQAVVADTWDIDKCKDTWSDRVDRVKMASVEAERGARMTWRLGRSRSGSDTCREV